MKHFFLILLFISGTIKMKAQCQPNIISNYTTGCAPLEVFLSCPDSNTGSGTWIAAGYTLTGLTVAVIFATPGVYPVTFTLITAGTPSCMGTASLSINVVTGPSNGCSSTVTGIKENINEPLTIYKDQQAGSTRIQLSRKIASGKVVLHTLLGEKIYESVFYGQEITIGEKDYGKGLMILNILEHDNLISCKKIIFN